MRQSSNFDLGSVQIHKKVIAEIISSAIKDVDGVKLVDKGILTKVNKFFGIESFYGIDVKVDRNQDVNLELKVIIEYGLNIPDAARQVQDAIKTAMDKTVDVNIKDINVNIQGIERVQK